MSDQQEESWVRAVSSMMHFYLLERTRARVSPDEFRGLRPGQVPSYPSTDFLNSWQSVTSDLYYRLRAARTRRVFADCLTRTVFSISQGKLNRHLETITTMLGSETQWEDLRDVMMLSLSAKAYRPEIQPEDRPS